MPVRSKTIVISDVHIGNNYRTCWYQRDHHESYLVALLEEIVRRKDEVRRLVILGDLFDFWTYPPNYTPPLIGDILDANPAIFGKTGKLVEAVNALEGRVVYLRGNHDINITQQDLNKIPGNYRIPLVPDGYTVDGVTFAHGHYYTLFNAPPFFDASDPMRPPGGYFVTRTLSYKVEKLLDRKGSKAQTVADLAGWAAPSPNIDSITGAILKGQLDGVYKSFMGFMQGDTGMSDSEKIQMPGGKVTTLEQAKKTYADVATEWAASHGGSWDGNLSAYKAIWADKDGSYLAWFAEVLRRRTGADLVVMGHTHTPKCGLVSREGGATVGRYLNGGEALYLNTGFLCPPKPDLDSGAAVFTYGQIEHGDRTTGQVWKIGRSGGGFDFKQDMVGPDWLVSSGLLGTGKDYSCYVEVFNHTHDVLRVAEGSTAAPYGHFVALPGDIPSGRVGSCWTQDYPAVTGGVTGSEGKVTYGGRGRAKIDLTFGCPFIESNYAGGAPYTSAVDTGGPRGNAIDTTGKPVFVQFSVVDASPLSSTTTPALAAHTGTKRLWTAFGPPGQGSKLEVASTTDGATWAQKKVLAGSEAKSAPALATFGGKLWLCFVGASSPSGELRMTSSADGSTWAAPHGLGMNAKFAPALAVHGDRLWLAYVSSEGGDNRNRVCISSTKDGSTWDTPLKLGMLSRTTPALASFGGRLWIAFMADNETGSILLFSSRDGRAWTESYGVVSSEVVAGPSLSSHADRLVIGLTMPSGSGADFSYVVVRSSPDGRSWSTLNVDLGTRRECGLASYAGKLWVAASNRADHVYLHSEPGLQVWGLNRSHQLWRWLGGTTWEQIPGALTQVAVSGSGDVWGVNATQPTSQVNIYRWDGGEWKSPANGMLSSIGVGSDGSVWGCNPSGSIFRRDGTKWADISGAASRVAVASRDEVWVISVKGDGLYRWDGARWAGMPLKKTPVADVAVAGDGTACMVDGAGAAWRWNGFAWDSLPLPGKTLLARIAVADFETVWGVTTQDKIVRYNGQTWVSDVADATVALTSIAIARAPW